MPKVMPKFDPDFELVSKQQTPLVESCPFISYETRVRLIKMVFQEKVKTKKATRSLGINMSTAKNILKVFRRKGRIHVRKQERGKIFPQKLLQDIEKAKQIIRLEDEKLLKKAKKLQMKKKGIKKGQEEKDVQVVKQENSRNQNEVMDQNMPKTLSNDVPEFQGCDNLIKEEPQQVFSQNITKTVIKQVPKQEQCQHPIKEQAKQYYKTFLDVNMNNQNLNFDPSVKSQNVKIGPEFPDYFAYHPYYLQNFYY